MRIPQIVTYTVGEKKWRTKENKGKLWQNHDPNTGAAVVGEKAQNQATLNSEEIKPVAITIIELCLSEGISQ